jgi:hypothetical protein
MDIGCIEVFTVMITKGSNSTQELVRRQFVFLASELSNTFPELDLRFNLRSGTNQLRYKAAAVSQKIFELPLGESDSRALLHQALFTIKEAARLYDA